ncbi:hypothetical protein HN873_051806, partial [Arachis hypogaea]
MIVARGDVAEKIVIEGYRHRRQMQKIAIGEVVVGGDVTGEDCRWRRLSENAIEKIVIRAVVGAVTKEDDRHFGFQSLESTTKKIAGAASLFRVSLLPDKISVRVFL